MDSFTQSVKGLDFFAYPVTLTYRRLDKHKSFAGGCVTILIVLALLLYSLTTLYSLMFSAEYSSFPTEYDYSRDRPNVNVDLYENLIAYAITSDILSPMDTLAHFRLKFND